MSAAPCKLANKKCFQSGSCKQSALQVLILGAFLVCTSSAFAQDETSYENVNVNGIVLNGFEVFALEQATGLDIPNGNYWYDMATDQWGYEGGPAEGFLNLPESFKEYLNASKENSSTTPTELAQTASYSDCAGDDCWY